MQQPRDVHEFKTAVRIAHVFREVDRQVLSGGNFRVVVVGLYLLPFPNM